jgi:hypothetical protein
MPNVQIKLTEFSDLITHYIADFVGREWLAEQVLYRNQLEVV